jgi:hypothetical protein
VIREIELLAEIGIALLLFLPGRLALLFQALAVFAEAVEQALQLVASLRRIRVRRRRRLDLHGLRVLVRRGVIAIVDIALRVSPLVDVGVGAAAIRQQGDYD